MHSINSKTDGRLIQNRLWQVYEGSMHTHTYTQDAASHSVRSTITASTITFIINVYLRQLRRKRSRKKKRNCQGTASELPNIGEPMMSVFFSSFRHSAPFLHQSHCFAYTPLNGAKWVAMPFECVYVCCYCLSTSIGVMCTILGWKHSWHKCIK